MIDKSDDAKPLLSIREFLTGPYRQGWGRGVRAYNQVYRRLSHNFSQYFDFPLSYLTPLAVDTWKNCQPKAATTVNRDLAELSALYSRAVEWGYCPNNPVSSVKFFRTDKLKKARYLSGDEERRLYKVLIGHPLRSLVTFALNTGMRRGELFALKWGDLDVSKGIVTVNGLNCKTRNIPLNKRVLNVIPEKVSEYVFVNHKGHPLTQIRRQWEWIAREASLGNFRFHDLRHSFASKLVMNGVDLDTVRELLGHTTLQMTIRYAHLSDEVERGGAVECL